MSYSVSEILQKAKEIIEFNEEIGGYIQIKGEVGTFKVYGKHAYLNLKEENAVLKCVYFMVPLEISKTIKDGSIVEAYGYLSIYEARGEFQFYIKSMREISKAGLLILAYERIKNQLIAEKIIPKSPEEKKPLPPFPETIGVITSRNGAAIQDVIKTVEKRYPQCLIQLFHSGVQGKVENDIVKALSQANTSKVDVLLLIRGGGSIEDLWCFNHPKVVKAVRKSVKPIIVGVGHETDHTLCEYAADYIGSTPTSAAMIATPDMVTLMASKRTELEKISLSLKKKKTEQENAFRQMMKIVHHMHPAKIISKGLQDMYTLVEKISVIVDQKMIAQNHRLAFIQKSLEKPTVASKIQRLETQLMINQEKIKSNDPDRFLKKGLTRIEKDGVPVNSVVQLKAEDAIQFSLKDGIVHSTITQLTKKR